LALTYNSDPHNRDINDNEGGGPPLREPIFNRMPIGVAILIAVILAMHLFGFVIGPEALANFEAKYGVVPERVFAQVRAGAYLEMLTPLLTSQFLHSGPLHLIMNLAMLLQAGPIAEIGLNRNRDEAARFMIFYLVCGIGGGLAFCLINPDSQILALGASGAISGVFAGFLWAAIGLAKPGQRMLRPVLVSGLVFLLINVGLAWISRATNFVAIAWECHLGGFITGLIVYPLFARLGRTKPPHIAS
jgi:membrane associated rhomboid family serine protease